MMILYSPQVNFFQQNSYSFEGEVITATIDEKSEVFDFTNLPNGKAETIESEVFDFCPVLSAERKDGVLYLELLNFINLDATEKERFPEWQEIENG